MSASVAAFRSLAVSVAICTSLLSARALADEPPAIPRIGVLVYPLPISPFEAGLRDGLRELGYIEGKNVIVEWRRSAGGDAQRLAVADLARTALDVIVVFSTPAAREALKATTKVPIVFLSGDPVASGLAASLARPGGNATGVSGVMADLTAKRMQFLREAAPHARRIACLVNSSNPSSALEFEEAQGAARTLSVELVKLDVRNISELDAALRALPRSGGKAVLVTADSLFFVNKAKVARAVRKSAVPAMFPFREYHEDGVFMTYGTNMTEAARKMAVYVDKILKGAKPSDLPIEQMSKYELVIDLRVARALGLAVPPALLARADEVIR